MAKFVGKLAVITEQTEKVIDGIPSGIYVNSIKEYKIAGDLLNSNLRIQQEDKINDEFHVTNRFSVLASPSLISVLADSSKASHPAYIEYMGMKLKVSDMQITPPRIIFSVGGLWTQD